MLQTIHQSVPAFVQREIRHYCSRFWRCFYSMAKEYFGEEEEEGDDRRKSRCTRFRRYRDLAILFYFTRLFFPTFIVHHVTNPKVIRAAASVDPAVIIFSQNIHFFQPFMAVVLYLLVVSDYLIQQAFNRFEELKRRCNHSSSNITWWQWWYELVVFNQDAYLRAVIQNARLKVVHDRWQTILEIRFPLVAKFAPKPLFQLATKLFVLWNLENVDKAALFDRRQHIRPAHSFAHLSVKVRTNLLRYLFTVDLLTFFGLIGVVVMIFALFISNYLSYNGPPMFCWCIPSFLVATDFLLTLFFFTRTLQSVLFVSNCALISTIVHTGYSLELQKGVQYLLGRYSKGGGEHLNFARKETSLPFLPYSFYNHIILSNQLTEHNKICSQVLRSNGQLFANILMRVGLAQLPVNVYLLRRSILFSRLDDLTDDLIWLLILGQVMACLTVFLPFAFSAEVHHRPKRFLPRVGALLRGDNRWLLLQLKLDALFGRLIGVPKIAFSIGSLKQVTTQSAVELLGFYAGFLLIAFSQTLHSTLLAEKERIIRIED